MHRLTLLAFFLLLTLSGVRADPLSGAAAKLYQKGLAESRHRLLSSSQPGLEPTSDGRSYMAVWQTCAQPQRWIVSLHGSRGFAIQDLAVWQPHLRGREVGVVCLQWWLGEGDRTEDYLTPRQIYHELDLALQRHNLSPKSVVLEGFSRGSTQTFALA